MIIRWYKYLIVNPYSLYHKHFKSLLTWAYKIQINKVARKSKAARRQNSRRHGEKERHVPEETDTRVWLLEEGRWVPDSASDPWLTKELNILIQLDTKEHQSHRARDGNRNFWWRWPSKKNGDERLAAGLSKCGLIHFGGHFWTKKHGVPSWRYRKVR